jgi:hypothetical protein
VKSRQKYRKPLLYLTMRVLPSQQQVFLITRVDS